MIAKIKTGNYTKGLIQYHNDKEKIGTAEIFHSTLDNFKEMKPETIEKIFKSFTFNSKRKDINFHVSLNFTEEDFKKVDEVQKKQIIELYMKGIGFPEDHPFVAYQHSDKKHPHIHVICPKILENGKALNDSNLFQRSRMLTRELEHRFHLSNAEERTEKKKDELKEDISVLLKRYEQKEIPLNEYLRTVAVMLLDKEKPVDFEQYKQMLTKNGIYVYQTDHKNTGLIYTIKQNTTELKAKDTGIKSYKLDKNRLSYNKLSKEFEKNRASHLKYISKSIDFVFKKYDIITFETFIKELKKRSVEIKVNRRNNEIKGLSFGYKAGMFKGQELPGRDYTWGKLKTGFSERDEISQTFIVEIKVKTSGIDRVGDIKEFSKACIDQRLFAVYSNEGVHLHNVFQGKVSSGFVTLTALNPKLSGLSDQQLKTMNESFLKEFTDTLLHHDKPEHEQIHEPLELFDDIFSDLQSSSDLGEEAPVIGKKRKKPRI